MIIMITIIINLKRSYGTGKIWSNDKVNLGHSAHSGGDGLWSSLIAALSATTTARPNNTMCWLLYACSWSPLCPLCRGLTLNSTVVQQSEDSLSVNVQQTNGHQVKRPQVNGSHQVKRKPGSQWRKLQTNSKTTNIIPDQNFLWFENHLELKHPFHFQSQLGEEVEGDAVVAAAHHHHLLGLGGQREDGGLPRHLSHNNQVIHPDTFNKIHSYRLIHADMFIQLHLKETFHSPSHAAPLKSQWLWGRLAERWQILVSLKTPKTNKPEKNV